MKKTLTCPKCEGRTIVHVARMKVFDAEPVFGLTATRRALPLAIRTKGMNVPHGVGGFESFICHACHYSELYAVDLDQLDPAIDKDVRIIDNEPKATLR